MLYRVHLAMSGNRTHNLSSDNTDCIGSCKSNYHTVTTTTAPWTKVTVTKLFIEIYFFKVNQTFIDENDISSK